MNFTNGPRIWTTKVKMWRGGTVSSAQYFEFSRITIIITRMVITILLEDSFAVSVNLLTVNKYCKS